MATNESIRNLKQTIRNLEEELARHKSDLKELQPTNKVPVSNYSASPENTHKQSQLSSESLFQQLFNGVEQGIWVWELDKDLALPDSYWFTILGYDPLKEKFGFDWWLEHLHPECRLNFKKALKEYLEGRSPDYELEYRIKSASGHWYWFWTRGVVSEYLEEGIPSKMIGIYRQITKSKTAESRLRKTQERYSALFERSRDAVYVLDLKGRFLDANPAAIQLTGFKIGELSKLSLTDLLHEESINVAENVIREVTSTGSQENFTEYQIRNKQGGIVWVESKSSLIEKNGRPYAIQGIARDITERKLIENQIVQTNLLLTSLIESPSTIIIYALDHRYCYTTFNGAHAKEMRDKIGVSIKIGDNILENLSDAGGRKRLKDNLDQALAGVRLSKIEQFGFGNQQDWYESSYNPIYDDSGNVYGITVFVSNISERILTQEKLNKQEGIFRALVENSPDIIIRMDCNLRFVYVNPAFCWFTEIPYIELIGKVSSQLNLCHESFQILEDYIEKVVSSGQSYTAEFYYKRNEEKVFFQARIVPETDQEAGVNYVLCILRDITVLKKVEEQLQVAQSKLEERVSKRTSQLTLANVQLRTEVAIRKQTEEKLIFAKHHAELSNKFKTEFLANISHELRTPMHHILNYSRFGIEKIDRPKEKLKHYFSQIRTTGERLLYLVNQLLDLSKLESGKMDYLMESTDLREVVGESIVELSSLAEEKQVDIITEQVKGDTIVVCDGYKIGQVVRNLLSNSIKFTPGGKKIFLTFSDAKLNIKMRSISAMKVSISDQGIGIPPQEIRSVFDKFVQSSTTKTGAGGTGLGLAISRRIIEDHKGRLWAQNNPDCGVTVSFILPKDQQTLTD